MHCLKWVMLFHIWLIKGYRQGPNANTWVLKHMCKVL